MRGALTVGQLHDKSLVYLIWKDVPVKLVLLGALKSWLFVCSPCKKRLGWECRLPGLPDALNTSYVSDVKIGSPFSALHNRSHWTVTEVRTQSLLNAASLILCAWNISPPEPCFTIGKNFISCPCFFKGILFFLWKITVAVWNQKCCCYSIV
jgi:hypothetical protein